MSNVRLRPERISPAPEFPGSPTRSRKSRPLSRICKQKPFPELKKQRRDIFVTPAIYLASGERGRSVDSEARVTLSTPDHWQITVSVAPPSSVAPGGPCPLDCYSPVIGETQDLLEICHRQTYHVFMKTLAFETDAHIILEVLITSFGLKD